MPLCAMDGSHTNDVTANDITYQIWDPYKYPYDCGTPENPDTCYDGGYDDYDGSSTIHGTVNASSNVYVNGVPIAKIGDSVSETEDPNVPSDAENIENADGGTGSIVEGNSSNVYVNGVLAAVIGSTVQTHTNPTTTIADGSTNVYIG